MEPVVTYEKVDNGSFKKVIPTEVVIDIKELAEKRRHAVDARNRFQEEAAAQQAIIDAIDVDLQEARKIGVSTSIEVDQVAMPELSAAPLNETEPS